MIPTLIVQNKLLIEKPYYNVLASKYNLEYPVVH
jgi:hypothetical protein